MKKSGDFVARKVGHNILLVPLRPGEEGLWVYELSETAAFLWNCLDTCETEADLAKNLQENFVVDEQESFAGVKEFLDDLKQVGAVQ